jgi:hypothetical protein
MPKLSKTLMSAKPMFYETVKADTDFKTRLDPAYDSKLQAPPGPGQNWILRITLRVYYRQIDPDLTTAAMMMGLAAQLGIPPTVVTALYPDSDDHGQIIKEWTLWEWTNFITVLRKQANKWNNVFWLIPPDEFPFFDFTDPPGSRTRPNVKCEFELDSRPLLPVLTASLTLSILRLTTSFDLTRRCTTLTILTRVLQSQLIRPEPSLPLSKMR